MSERLPPPSSSRIRATAPRRDEIRVLRRGTRLVRIHTVAGVHPSGWNRFRSFGPTSCRFDHQPPRSGGPQPHPRRRIAYVTWGNNAFVTAIAELFQDAAGGVGPVDTRTSRPVIAIFELKYEIRLLDLESGWVTRAGGNQSICTGHRGRSRDWARATYSAFKDLDGLAYRSSVWGPGSCAALWERAERALPPAPLSIRTLDDPAIAIPVAVAAVELGTFVIP